MKVGRRKSPPPFVLPGTGMGSPKPEDRSSGGRYTMTPAIRERGKSGRSRVFLLAAVVGGLSLAGCQSTMPTGETTSIDAAQGSEGNISSLTAVIERNPRDPEAYNVRGSAYGRGGRYREALQDFDTAIQLSPNFYQA